MVKKFRLDEHMVNINLAPDLKTAQSIIMLGYVLDGTKKLEKPGLMVHEDIQLTIKSRKEHNYVSRGALKLIHAIKHFSLDVKGLNCVDIGCSTGGFTEVLLQEGASHIYAVDVGYGEFDWKLRNNEKITLYERTNARHLTTEHFKAPLDLIVCDASFISLMQVLEPAINFLHKKSRIVALIKPQFEAMRSEVGEKGIIKDSMIHQKTCDKVQKWLEEKNFKVYGIVESPITGMKGNKEFLICAGKDE
jgi:23S rRNA (cytidine1920-2'-O)/16S rRNA (cytidine1409-2'-O)-methyltransferase